MFARAAASAAAALSLTAVLGCGSPTVDLTAARRFDAYPLYWLGSRFEQWNLEQVLGPDGLGDVVTLIYGTCRPHDGEQPSCSPPLQLQLSPLCRHLNVVTASPAWRHQRIRGAPVGRNPDGAAVLLARRTQVKVYRGGNSDSGVALRALRALRSLNRVPPVIDADDPIPNAARGVLEGTEECAAWTTQRPRPSKSAMVGRRAGPRSVSAHVASRRRHSSRRCPA